MKSMTDVYARLVVDVCLDVGGDRLKERVGEVLTLMQRRGDGHLARELPEAVDGVYAELSKWQEVSVSVARTSRELVRTIARALARNEEDVRVTEDPSVIGGAIVRVGNTVIDASVRGALAQLKNRLVVRK